MSRCSELRERAKQTLDRTPDPIRTSEAMSPAFIHRNRESLRTHAKLVLDGLDRRLGHYSDEVGEVICRLAQAGCTRAEITKKLGISKSTFANWMVAVKGLEDRYLEARDKSDTAVADKIIDIVDGVEPDKNHIAKAKLQSDTRWKQLQVRSQRFADKRQAVNERELVPPMIINFNSDISAQELREHIFPGEGRVIRPATLEIVGRAGLAGDDQEEGEYLKLRLQPDKSGESIFLLKLAHFENLIEAGQEYEW